MFRVRVILRWTALCLVAIGILAPCIWWLTKGYRPTRIAVIPRTCGTLLWEGEHVGVARAARALGYEIYWNAPLREDDVQSQIGLVQKVMRKRYAGLILAPQQSRPLMTTVVGLEQRGIPVVIVGTELNVDPGSRLGYVLSDEHMAGEMAARQVAQKLHGHGTVALVGINRTLSSLSDRCNSFEHVIGKDYPDIHVVWRSSAHMNAAEEQQEIERMIVEHSRVDAIVALNESSTRGAYYALSDLRQAGSVVLVGFDQDMMSQLRHGGVDALIMQDTNRMGTEAVKMMYAQLHGGSSHPVVIVPPFLATRDTMHSAEYERMVNLVWFQ